mmetsp:Transcript_874/g.1680  ORF Transcript_874/g.1680 Transcript_874/m.1680 type:complete len:355 (-) Transcript_874:771-1835(-)
MSVTLPLLLLLLLLRLCLLLPLFFFLALFDFRVRVGILCHRIELGVMLPAEALLEALFFIGHCAQLRLLLLLLLGIAVSFRVAVGVIAVVGVLFVSLVAVLCTSLVVVVVVFQMLVAVRMIIVVIAGVVCIFVRIGIGILILILILVPAVLAQTTADVALVIVPVIIVLVVHDTRSVSARSVVLASKMSLRVRIQVVDVVVVHIVAVHVIVAVVDVAMRRGHQRYLCIVVGVANIRAHFMLQARNGNAALPTAFLADFRPILVVGKVQLVVVKQVRKLAVALVERLQIAKTPATHTVAVLRGPTIRALERVPLHGVGGPVVIASGIAIFEFAITVKIECVIKSMLVIGSGTGSI